MNATMDNLFQHSDGWNAQMINNCFLPYDTKSILQIPIGSENQNDIIMWHYNKSGNFIVKNGYWIGHGLEKKPDTYTLGALIQWGVQPVSCCAACIIGFETTLHVLWTCNKLKCIRNEWLSKNKAVGEGLVSFFDFIFDYLSKIYGDKRHLFCILLWRIWFIRNSSVHNTNTVDMTDIIGWSEKYLDDYRSLNKGNLVGEVMACSSQKVIVYNSSMFANVLAIQRGVQFGIDCGLNPKLIESDEATVIKWINLGNLRDSDVGNILSDIDVVRTANCGMRFSHIPS
ncbi:hypothetical protein LWI28_011684 [Acer negundo]|uniref:RNase H type-1 domain-containing protein n=1 Tax=Acer negundo TaxID=4023 RepID=A0AAD5NWI9_ACENE|nr:hypothetical protein LWI28_011684 [Acer negundo]